MITQNYGLPSPRKEWLPFAASDAVQYVFLVAADMPDPLYLTLGVRECCWADKEYSAPILTNA